MRNKWYGDNRDLAKWGILVNLAPLYHARHILQVLYFRPDVWPRVEIDGEMFDIHARVIEQFRQATSISEIECGTRIEVLDDQFSERRSYQEKILTKIRERRERPSIVFLDPDTGLQPRNADWTHVLDAELAEIWQCLNSGDLLAVYQHQTNRSGVEWRTPKKLQFERAIGIQTGTAKVARADELARDVVFFFAQKGQY